MFYKNKNSKEIAELIYSDSNYCIYVPVNEKNLNIIDGRIFFGNKKLFKKNWKKIKKVSYKKIDLELKIEIIKEIMLVKHKLMNEKELDDLIIQSQLQNPL